jgi:hypothetical protein
MYRRGRREDVLTSTEELGDGSLGTTHAPDLPAEGDDIVVIPGGAPDEPRGRQLLLIIGAAVVSIGVIVAAIALLTRHGGPTAQVAVRPPVPSVPVARTPTHPKPKSKPLPSKPAPPFARSTVPVTQPAQTPVSSPSVVTSPVSAAPAPTVPLAPPKEYGASALTWDAPHTMTIAAGKTAPLTVIAVNRTDGVVSLSHPLSCTPRLDRTEVCTEMVQTIQRGSSATATYTIDARGIAPGHYTLQIEGVLTVAVTVS